MTKESLEISDRLDPRVRATLAYALSPFNAKHFVGMDVDRAIAKIKEWDRDQHRGAVMAGVVPSVQGKSFELKPIRSRRVVRR